ncbi:hypothetical protein ACR80S_05595 [Halomonas sp. MA07-2]|uniref:hypothetical protein n=1 Tax=Halomonas sp. MA07-2 TaxID=3440841 RepID=UPI003EF06AAC
MIGKSIVMADIALEGTLIAVPADALDGDVLLPLAVRLGDKAGMEAMRSEAASGHRENA